jgi:hypothetical protein
MLIARRLAVARLAVIASPGYLSRSTAGRRSPTSSPATTA